MAASASGMAQQHAHRDRFLSRRRELRPVGGDGSVEVEQSTIDQDVGTDRRHRLGGREDVDDGVALPCTRTRGVGVSTPQVHHRPSIDGGRERRADLAAGVEGGGERVAHRGESRITRSLDHGTGYSIPARRPHALALRAATSCIVTTMVRRLACAALLLPVLAAAPGWSQIASPPQILGPLVGPGSIKPQPDLAFFGTDLGWTVEHQGELQHPVRRHRRHLRLRLPRAAAQRRLAGRDAAAATRDGRSAGDLPDRPERSRTCCSVSSCSATASRCRWATARCRSAPTVTGTNLVAIMGRGGTIPCKAGVTSPVAACRGPLEDHPAPRTGSAPTVSAARRGWASASRRRTESRPPCELATGAGCNPSRSARVHADGERALRGPVELAERRHASVRALHRGERDGVRDPGPGPPRPLRVRRDPAHQQVHQPHRAHRQAVHRDAVRATTTGRAWHGARLGPPGFSGEQGRQAQVYLLAHRLPIARRGQRALALSPALLRRRCTRGRTGPSGRISRRRRSRSRSTAWSEAARSRSSPW